MRKPRVTGPLDLPGASSSRDRKIFSPPRSEEKMAPGSANRAISQQAFDDMVRENVDDLGMDPEEALEDAIQALTLQGVDLSGIIKCIPGVSSTTDDPVLQTLESLQEMLKCSHEETGQLLDKLSELCSSEMGEIGLQNASIAARNGAVEMLCSFLEKEEEENSLGSALKALKSVLCDIRSSEIFQKNNGPKIITTILKKCSQTTPDDAFSVVAAAAMGNEIVKEAFVELEISEIFLKLLKERPKDCSSSIYDAMRVLLTPDDDRVLASQVYGYARRFAKMGISDALVAALKDGVSSSSAVPICSALKAVAVNDEICRSISDNGGIDTILERILQSIQENNKPIAKACCSLLTKLAGSDSNKNTIAQKRGFDALLKLSSKFFDDPSVLQEIMGVITALSLRSPDNAARAVEVGAADLAIEAMRKFSIAYQMQKQCCLMIRNLVARNPENRAIFLCKGAERHIRKVKSSNPVCKDAASAALRDLGLDDYN